ncbi:hypothetical protein ACQP1P_38590 [Dactylosporangium sp. CA-052675]|uniref:hypothetical protein n=1 Tax=Dactylosporangium sp. CA-052675 TaxID=3239927 RepID=UPI003D8C6C90
MKVYKVTSPYVTLRVRDDVLGQEVLAGFYAGAPLPSNVNQEDLERHVRKGMVAEEGTPEADAAVVGGQPVVFGQSDAGTPQSQVDQQQRGDRPRGNASRADWAAYAASQGAPEDETKAEDEGGLSRDDLRAKYGN